MADTAAPSQQRLGRLEHLIVTRPEPEARIWVDALRAAGWPAQALPLIDISPPQDESDRATLMHWRTHWPQADAILFVSGAAVTHFFSEATAPVGLSRRTRFWAPGPGTARQLAKAIAPWGMGTEQIDAPPADAAQFDSEHLWPVVSSQVREGRRVLVVRGSSLQATSLDEHPGVAGSGRDWLIQRCTAAGAQVHGCVAYERRVPVLSGTDRALIAQATAAQSAWLFSSSEAFLPLKNALPKSAWRQATALVTHPRIAATARLAGFEHVVQTRPALSDVMRTLESGWTRS